MCLVLEEMEEKKEEKNETKNDTIYIYDLMRLTSVEFYWFLNQI